MKCTAGGIQSGTLERLHAATDGNQMWRGDPFVIYRDSEPLDCAPGTNVSVVGQLRFKNSLKKISFSQLKVRSLMIVFGEKSLHPQGKFQRPVCLAQRAALFHLQISACLCTRSVAQWHQTVRPHRLQPTRLLCPSNFPGKNTGVGCHFLLQRSSQTQGLNPIFCVPSIGRWILYH